MTTRYRTAFMAPSGFTTTAVAPGKIGPATSTASERKAGPAKRAQSRAAEAKADHSAKSAAA